MKTLMMVEFEMKDLGRMSHFLGIKLHQDEKTNLICQNNYNISMLKKFDMEDCKPATTPISHGRLISKEDVLHTSSA